MMMQSESIEHARENKKTCSPRHHYYLFILGFTMSCTKVHKTKQKNNSLQPPQWHLRVTCLPCGISKLPMMRKRARRDQRRNLGARNGNAPFV